MKKNLNKDIKKMKDTIFIYGITTLIVYIIISLVFAIILTNKDVPFIFALSVGFGFITYNEKCFIILFLNFISKFITREILLKDPYNKKAYIIYTINFIISLVVMGASIIIIYI